MNTLPTYETSDLTLAAALRAYDVQLDRIILTEKKRGVFCFTNVPYHLLEQFDLQQLSVEPFAFHQLIIKLSTAVRRLKE